jgi:preprotein translocase subunit SecG
MITFLTIVYVFVCLFLILVVLLQAGKGGGMGAAFGGSGSQSVFGGAGAGNFLTRLTVGSAVAFMLLSATLAFLSSSSEKSLKRASEAVLLREKARKGELETKSKTTHSSKPGDMSLPEDVNSKDKKPSDTTKQGAQDTSKESEDGKEQPGSSKP